MAFTIFDSFADVFNDYDESDPQEVEERRMLADAIMSYGLNGTVPELPKGVRRVFMALRDAIDNSKDARAKGGKGGRPKKAKAAVKPEPEPENPETEVSGTENLGFENPETQVSETRKPPFPESGNPNLTCTDLTYTALNCVDGGACAAPDAPTEDEAVAYFGANCLNGDPRAFFDFYASQGWRKSNGMPIADWRSQARQWHRKQRELDAEARSRGKPAPSEVSAATFRPVAKLTPEQELAAVEEEARRYGIAL